jgi:hemerythrin superfamily protein
MPTNAKTKAKKSDERKTRAAKPSKEAKAPMIEKMNAIELLEQDHREVEAYFDEFEELEDDSAKGELAQKICMALTVHMQIEEELFYPAAREAIDDDDLLDEAVVEHAGAKNLIAEIEDMEPGEDLFDAKVKVLGEMIKHHVEEEEEEMFPEVEASDMDTDAVGAQLAKRKAELMKQLQQA